MARENFKAVLLEPSKSWVKDGKCAGCGKPKDLWTRRKDWNCCSQECTDTYRKNWLIWDWNEFRHRVFMRDNYICRICGKEIQDSIVKIKGWNGDYYDAKRERESLLVADHIIPIAVGGPQWDLNNVQTLCLECNKRKTASDMGDIAQYRRIKKQQKGNKTLV